MSRRAACWSGGTSRSNIRAAVATVHPWKISEIRTIMNATPKISVRPATPRGPSAADELVGKERMDVEDRINLGRGHIRPAEAERRHAQLHRPGGDGR
jgi:hypothetical protein